VDQNDIASLLRLERQALSYRTFEDRALTGQFMTPPAVIEWIFSKFTPGIFPRVLDPACGTGGFLLEAQKRGHGQQRLCGVEIDSELARSSSDLSCNRWITIHDDALRVPSNESFDLIVGSPPWVLRSGGIYPDFAADFTVSVVNRFLAPGGVVCFTLPWTVKELSSYESFRLGTWKTDLSIQFHRPPASLDKSYPIKFVVFVAEWLTK
jgi:SAM-dependent methyltransferase